MKVLLTGGGTGGHITPILAVAHELKAQQPDIELIYVGERHGKFRHLTDKSESIDSSYQIFAGKFRRYHGESWLARLVDVKTIFLNARDTLFVLLGVIQAWFLLRKVKPDVVFLKGGYVGVPVGLAAAARHIPIVTHDSDALPGLANRLVSRWANIHATALAAEHYSYPAQKVRPVGVLVEHTYQNVTPETLRDYKQQLRIPAEYKVVLITGASSGAAKLNEVVVRIIGRLLEKYPDLYIIHQVGKGKSAVYKNYAHERLQIQEFLQPMYQYMGAADIVVARASANTIAEIGTQGKACIVVPHPHLTGGHQIKNAQRLEEQQAALVVAESDLEDPQRGLMAYIERLLDDDNLREKLARTLQSHTPNQAAAQLAQILLTQAKTPK